jgi:hypothetical protein
VPAAAGVVGGSDVEDVGDPVDLGPLPGVVAPGVEQHVTAVFGDGQVGMVVEVVGELAQPGDDLCAGEQVVGDGEVV